MRWSTRRAALVDSIAALDADIVCLQEVEHFEGFWRPALRTLGYRGVYKQRGMGSKPDGCATFFRESRFKLVEHRGINFDRFRSGAVGAGQIAEASCRRRTGCSDPGFPTHNVALLTLLTPVLADGLDGTPPPRLVVANVHLFWDPGYEDLKLAQACAAVAAADQLALESSGGIAGGAAAVILAGDFNAMPESIVYEHLAREARFTSAYAAVGAAPATGPASLASPARYSPLDAAIAAAAEPPFTNFRDCFRGALDYIFLRDAAGDGPLLRTTAALGMIGEGEAAAEGGGLPSSRHPSDHLPIAADILLLPAPPRPMVAAP